MGPSSFLVASSPVDKRGLRKKKKRGVPCPEGEKRINFCGSFSYEERGWGKIEEGGDFSPRWLPRRGKKIYNCPKRKKQWVRRAHKRGGETSIIRGKGRGRVKRRKADHIHFPERGGKKRSYILEENRGREIEGAGFLTSQQKRVSLSW